MSLSRVSEVKGTGATYDDMVVGSWVRIWPLSHCELHLLSQHLSIDDNYKNSQMSTAFPTKVFTALSCLDPGHLFTVVNCAPGTVPMRNAGDWVYAGVRSQSIVRAIHTHHVP